MRRFRLFKDRLIMAGTCLLPVLACAENVYIERPGKEFAATQSQGKPASYPQASGQSSLYHMSDRNISQLYYPDNNRRDAAPQDNPWRSEGSRYITPQHRVRPWGRVPADAPLDQPGRDRGRTDSRSSRAYQPYPYPYQPAAPVNPNYMPGYGGYGGSPYGSGYMPGYGLGGNPYSPFGSYGGLPGYGFPGGMFW